MTDEEPKVAAHDDPHRLERYAVTAATIIEADPPKEWRCFHCDELFTDVEKAKAHFGVIEGDYPACKLNQIEGGLLELYRQAQQELEMWRNEDSKSDREFYILGATHAKALIEAEQRGWRQGLMDAVIKPPEKELGRTLAEGDVEQELITATGLIRGKQLTEQEWLKRLVRVVAKLPKDEWEELSGPAKLWSNDGIMALNKRRPVRPF